jgi:succinyl-diaminopimelate desuccinylase
MTTSTGGALVRGRPEVDSIVELSQTLIAIPSQGGIDQPGPIIEVLRRWLAEHRLEPALLHSDDGALVGVSVDIGSGDGPRYCLDACLDTAPFGDRGAWTDAPTAGSVRAGWLVGRGAADCKTAVAMFAHIGDELASRTTDMTGTLTLLFDADEHTGRFGGVRAYTDTGPRLDGVMIGYPGLDEIVVGARGFWRAALVVSGRSGHTGSRNRHVDNAIAKAAALVARLSGCGCLPEADDTFPLGPRITVTGISGGEGYSIVPDRCTVSVDIRLTPRYDAEWAGNLVREVCSSLDEEIPSRQPTTIEFDTTWPAYRLEATSRVATALRRATRQVLGRDVTAAVAGPSNIGNFLSTLSIEATCGFGVVYRNLHAADEAVEVASIPLVYDAYREAVRDLLAGPPAGLAG